ncbi:2-amino-4-hydroxy-6-hydroxymethyldihydropteridine diphosphokinase [Rheinheimera sp. 4Y26]|uniref:2-amino-4-hydroxy-6- hydroxymethyldihydropteridine diphosphokinase n=1 Tax=Rheinheimera sp. 4Y26 TaxID=2977811 RepID=UPI0021B111FA|nr:2-amino-4-hydroxy-6-hydroxymethyldihydropteridine diphosphokinase [Rheinheimera sp. 4Y26]MCT6698850.1 2-amino-4-hydroxy-6-hydroxymethyldihydropteridine diphosphokinase [Rheinheimera sp. 4Y26]
MAQIYISVGTNHNREHHIRMAVQELQQFFTSLQLSSVYESEAVGFKGDAFYNMVVGAQTSLSVADCVAVFKAIEDRHGRVRGGEKFCGRTLDLDLLTYDQVICQQPVELPRGEITENAFVLWPLAEIAPTVLHPVLAVSYQQLWQQYQKQQKIWPVPFQF